MKKIILIFGLIAGLIVSAIMVVSMALFADHQNMGGGMLLGYASMVLAFSMIFVAVKTYRDKHNGGQISFGKAFTIGLYITLIASTMYLVAWAIEYNFFIPDFMDKYAAGMMRKAAAEGLSAQELQAKLRELEKGKEMYKNPLYFALFTYMEILPVGMVISLTTALFLKRNRMEPAGA